MPVKTPPSAETMADAPAEQAADLLDAVANTDVLRFNCQVALGTEKEAYADAQHKSVNAKNTTL